MFIQNNTMTNQAYVPYTQSLNRLSNSTRKLATGEKLPSSVFGAGELGVAEKWERRYRSEIKLIDGMNATVGLLNSKDSVLDRGMEVLQRMSELASSALDFTKVTGDRMALDAEYQALKNEFSSLADRRHNGLSLFGNSLSVRIGLSVGDTVYLTQLTLDKLNLAGGISQLTLASAALGSINNMIISLNNFRALTGQSVNQLNRTIDFTRQRVTNLKNSTSFIRDIDIAVETEVFTREQMLMSAAQSVLVQANGVMQNAQAFFG